MKQAHEKRQNDRAMAKPGGAEKPLRRRALTLLLALSLGLASTSGMAQVEETDEGVTLNLKDAEITSLINTVAEITGENFIPGNSSAG